MIGYSLWADHVVVRGVGRIGVLFENLKADLARCGETTGQRVREVLFNSGMWAVLGYRFRYWAVTRDWFGGIQRPLNFLASLVGLMVEVTTNITLPITAQIGPGLYIAHTGYIVVAKGTSIGRHCTLTQGVTIGHGGGGTKSASGGVPVLGNRVYVGPGAAIIGPIEVGDDALIGVGAIVTRSVPPRGVAVGNPARVRSVKGSFDLITYPGMDQDLQRLASHMLAQEEMATQAPANPGDSQRTTSGSDGDV